MKGKKQDIHELIRIEAFLLSEKAGHPSHMHDYFWAQAEAIVRQRAAIVDIAVKASGKKTGKAGKSVKRKPAAIKAKKVADPTPPVAAAPVSAEPKQKKAAIKKAAPAKKAVDSKKASKSK